MFFKTFFEIIGCHLENLYNSIKEVWILSQHWCALNVHWQLFEFLPNIIKDSWWRLKVIRYTWVSFELKLWNMCVSRLYLILFIVLNCYFISILCSLLGILNLKDFKILLSSTIVMLTCCPVIVKFGSNFSIFLFLIWFRNKWMLK